MKRNLDLHSQELIAPGQVQQIVMNEYPRAVPGQAASPSVNQTLTPVGHSPVLFGNSIQDSTLPFLVAQTGVARFTSADVNGQGLRVYIVALRTPASITAQGVYAVLEIFQNRETYNSIERTFDIILFLGIPLGLFVALVAGWWIARAALRPIDRFSRTVRTIGESRDLRRRLNFVGPSDEVGRLAETFDDMMDRLERAFETQKRFVADASHELRTPLTAIRGNADLMAIAPPEEREICLAAIRKEATRMSRLVSDLLLLAEADVETQPLQCREVDLDELVLEAHHSALVLADGRIDVVVERVDHVCVSVDPDRIQQLLLNLLDNAVKFTPDGGVVTLSLVAREKDVLLEVADSGVGIPEDAQASIFQRFYRVEEARSTRGNGLGLAICAWIVAMHSGTIGVRSQPGKGSTFFVTLPRAGEAGPDTPHGPVHAPTHRRLLTPHTRT
jgi:signal transduction histidine kinase